MKNLFDTEGTVLFPFQTEIILSGRFTPQLKPFTSVPVGNRTEAILERLSLYFASYGLRGLCAAVVWAVVPWLKAFIVSNLRFQHSGSRQ